jgi:predicted MPP superfamily phosphohydrolase
MRFAFHRERVGAVIENHTTNINLRHETQKPLAAPGVASLLSRLPGNQVFDLRVQEKQLVIPRLSSRHDGVRIAHLSDLHMSGRITKSYFERVVEQVNRTEPDIVAITGDLVERPECLDWIPDTFGQLRAASGVFYVLGNHDKHVDEHRLHAMLADAGLVYLGRTWRQLTIREVPLILAGNELPWYAPAADLRDCPPRDSSGAPSRIVLAHSPDQFGWAQKHDVDLILAGHNHGGQVRLPLLGPILAPSRHGVRYAAGAFRAGNTVMHVSRGTACLTPVRYNCPPEIALLVLRAAT